MRRIYKYLMFIVCFLHFSDEVIDSHVYQILIFRRYICEFKKLFHSMLITCLFASVVSKV